MNADKRRQATCTLREQVADVYPIGVCLRASAVSFLRGLSVLTLRALR